MLASELIKKITQELGATIRKYQERMAGRGIDNKETEAIGNLLRLIGNQRPDSNPDLLLSSIKHITTTLRKGRFWGSRDSELADMIDNLSRPHTSPYATWSDIADNLTKIDPEPTAAATLGQLTTTIDKIAGSEVNDIKNLKNEFSNMKEQITKLNKMSTEYAETRREKEQLAQLLVEKNRELEQTLNALNETRQELEQSRFEYSQLLEKSRIDQSVTLSQIPEIGYAEEWSFLENKEEANPSNRLNRSTSDPGKIPPNLFHNSYKSHTSKRPSNTTQNDLATIRRKIRGRLTPSKRKTIELMKSALDNAKKDIVIQQWFAELLIEIICAHRKTIYDTVTSFSNSHPSPKNINTEKLFKTIKTFSDQDQSEDNNFHNNLHDKIKALKWEFSDYNDNPLVVDVYVLRGLYQALQNTLYFGDRLTAEQHDKLLSGLKAVFEPKIAALSQTKQPQPGQ